MIEGISGTATFTCSRCGQVHSLEKEDFSFEAVSGSERGMGQETQYKSEHDLPCSSCGNVMHIEFEVWEYPVGAINHTNQTASGASNVKSEFEIIYSPDPQDSEEENNRVVGAVAGGAILGASLGGPIGAFIGGVVGGILGESVNKSKKGGKIMDKAIFIPSAILGLILILIYWYRCGKAKKEFNQSVMVNAVLQSSGIVCGVLLVAGTLNEDARKLLNEIDLYIFISGLVVLATSVKGIYKDIFTSTKFKQEKVQKGQVSTFDNLM